MRLFKKKAPADTGLKELNQEIYKHNVELAVVNKTLSLLRKLYQVSLLPLTAKELAEQMAEAVRADLNFELAGILLRDRSSGELMPLAYAKTDRLRGVLGEAGISLEAVSMPAGSYPPAIASVFADKQSAAFQDLEAVWGKVAGLSAAGEAAHLRTAMAIPLAIEKDFGGVLLLGMNREYSTLSDHERDAIRSASEVMGVALDKAYLYEDLRQANEKLRGLDRLKTEFLSLASHQLRSPLTAIKGYASMLLEGSFGSMDEKPKEAVNRIFLSAQNLVKVVEDLLDVSKIEQGGMKYEMQDVDLGSMAREIVSELSVQAEARSLKLSFSGDEQLKVHGDPVKLRQVFVNLIDNAIKYTKEGSVAVTLEKEGSMARITVRDTGMGMTPEIRATLFQKFSRGEGGRMNAGGSGLGLYLAKEIVEAHKGRVWAESDGPGKGSSFIAELPA